MSSSVKTSRQDLNRLNWNAQETLPGLTSLELKQFESSTEISCSADKEFLNKS